MSRFIGLAGLSFVLSFFVCAASGQSLRQLADQRGIRIGAAVDPSHFGETAYATTLSREFNQAQPENVMKFGLIHPGANTYSFSAADSIVAFAQANSMAVRGHTLVWYQQNPTWLTGGNYTPAQLSAILQDHITTVMGHYAGQVYAWDVVNEAFNDDGTLRSTIWSNTPGIGLTGTGYIEQALRWARAADPKALLFYNDYNGETVNSKSDAIYKMAQDFLARGVPLDGVGFQMHLTANPGSLTSMTQNLQRFADLGLQVQITEFDVRLPVDSSGVASASSLATQAQIYQNITTLCLKIARCTAVQAWGFTDKYSWIPGTFAGFGAGLPFDATYQAKSASTSMLTALTTSPPVIPAAGLVNGASYQGGTVAPGEIVTLFGATFGPATLAYSQLDSGGKFPSTAAGARVWFDGVAAPVIYARVGQTAVVVPFSVAGKQSTTFWYDYQGYASNMVTIPVTATMPGIFSLDSSGKGPGAILDVAYQAITDGNPAHTGDAVQMFATGGGVTVPASNDGELAPGNPPPTLVSKASVTIGGVDSPVLYQGAAPGLIAGVVQINVQIPAGLPPGPQPVILTIGGVASATGLTIAIR